MATKTLVETTLEFAWVPAPMIDSGAQMTAAKLVMEHTEATPSQRAEACLRLAELLRRVDPQGALELVAEYLPAKDNPHDEGYCVEAARIAAHSHLALGEYDVARAWAKLVGELMGETRGARLLQAKITHLQRRDDAITLLTDIIADESLLEKDPEVATEALFLRGRWLGEAGQFPAAIRDFKALEALSTQLGAPLTGAFAQVGRRISEVLGSKSIAGSIPTLIVAQLKTILTEGLEEDPALGPIPLWLHGLMTHTVAVGKPDAFPKVALLLGLFMENAELFEDAYLTYLYGSKLTQRLHLEDQRLALHLDRFLQRVGEKKASTLRKDEESRLRGWLH
ncbi:MAG: hypothetical protein AUK47_09395 [Deltaproteobacteria bacterium CG2_30_63_29]|nr:MAG: hypothetical protein AUK47_09395 [Deltaproteobacteria bacterium CG2_30_63_29]PJB49257.1 MAG: hypothetical protein CO108_00450 [Deltaproteobacteria bacterium CG_4_9_14_3_um_filter_63_12]